MHFFLDLYQLTLKEIRWPTVMGKKNTIINALILLKFVWMLNIFLYSECYEYICHYMTGNHYIYIYIVSNLRFTSCHYLL